MPYKSEKIVIAHTKYDRRVKLDDDDKYFILKQYNKGQSIRSLSREYGVDRNVIRIIVNPDFAKRFRENNIKRQKKYRENRVYNDKHNEYMRNHRRYKQELYKKGEIE